MVNQFFECQPTILVFDSGVGGLSIYDEIRQLLPNLHYIYAFDNVGFPYGEKSEWFITNRILKIVTKIQQNYSISLAVIACNTASIISLPVLRRKFQFPFIGVVPAVKPAVLLTKNRIIGLLATKNTINHPYTHKLIKSFARNCQVEMLDSFKLVKLAEEKMYGKVVPLDLLNQILQPWLRMPKLPDTIVLGCTHFPLLRNELYAVLPKGIFLVDSGAAIARRSLWLIKHKVLNVKSIKKNIAYCMNFTPEIKKSLSVCLRQYNFEALEKLVL